MFVMMNAARLQVGVQGVGVAERAYQQALAFALERRQGRSAWTGASVAIFDHPDVRRTLMLMKAQDRGGARASAWRPPSPPTSAALAGNPVDRDAAPAARRSC